MDNHDLVKHSNQIDTPEKCQLFCNAEDECNSFTHLGNDCWLDKKHNEEKKTRSRKSSEGGLDKGATGPKNCFGE